MQGEGLQAQLFREIRGKERRPGICLLSLYSGRRTLCLKLATKENSACRTAFVKM